MSVTTLEQWITLPDTNNHIRISTLGRVFNTHSNSYISTRYRTNTTKSIRCTTIINGKKFTLNVGKLVRELFGSDEDVVIHQGERCDFKESALFVNLQKVSNNYREKHYHHNGDYSKPEIELWLPHPKYKDTIRVSNCGRIFSINSNCYVRVTVINERTKRLRAYLKVGGKAITIYVTGIVRDLFGTTEHITVHKGDRRFFEDSPAARERNRKNSLNAPLKLIRKELKIKSEKAKNSIDWSVINGTMKLTGDYPLDIKATMNSVFK